MFKFSTFLSFKCLISSEEMLCKESEKKISFMPLSPPIVFKKAPSSTVEVSFKGSNTSGVTDMVRMFASCSGLTSLDVSNFDTSNVTDMFYMFGYCHGFTSLDLSKWDTSKVTNMNSMFSGCNALQEIKMIGCSSTTIDKIKTQLKADGLREDIVKTE